MCEVCIYGWVGLWGRFLSILVGYSFDVGFVIVRGGWEGIIVVVSGEF